MKAAWADLTNQNKHSLDGVKPTVKLAYHKELILKTLAWQIPQSSAKSSYIKANIGMAAENMRKWKENETEMKEGKKETTVLSKA